MGREEEQKGKAEHGGRRRDEPAIHICHLTITPPHCCLLPPWRGDCLKAVPGRDKAAGELIRQGRKTGQNTVTAVITISTSSFGQGSKATHGLRFETEENP
jgi:hypothetical protein